MLLFVSSLVVAKVGSKRTLSLLTGDNECDRGIATPEEPPLYSIIGLVLPRLGLGLPKNRT